jgi:hypothetical protein
MHNLTGHVLLFPSLGSDAARLTPFNSQDLKELFRTQLIDSLRVNRRAVDGAAMSTRLDRIGFDRIGRGALGWPRGSLSQSSDASPARFFKTMLLLLLALVVAAGAWLLMSGSRGGSAGREVAKPPLAVAAATLAEDSVPRAVAYDPFTSEAVAPEQPTPLDRLRLSGQSFHRGGLGSNAQESFTLRNGNEYAVKDVTIACAFIRRDGRHLTDRTRLVPGTIEMRSRKSFERLHIGCVNVNASKAKCALVSASRS